VLWAPTTRFLKTTKDDQTSDGRKSSEFSVRVDNQSISGELTESSGLGVAMSSKTGSKGPKKLPKGEVTLEEFAWRTIMPVGAALVGFVIFIYVGWEGTEYLLYSEQKQPVDFNHAIHQEAVDDGCNSCHFFREDGSFSGIPGLDSCIECHEEPAGEEPEELRFIDAYVKPQKEIPWLVYSRQPICVYFSHAAHVKMANMKCEDCHGPIGQSKHVKPYQSNILTGYSRDIWGWDIAGFKKRSYDSMKMDDCADCHRLQGANNACFVCHK